MTNGNDGVNASFLSSEIRWFGGEHPPLIREPEHAAPTVLRTDWYLSHTRSGCGGGARLREEDNTVERSQQGRP